jgi:uncharacterized membrane protein
VEYLRMDTLKNYPLFFITLAGAGLRLGTLTTESLWYDETFTAWLAGLPLPNLIAATMGDVHPPTWYMLEWGMAQLLGNNAFALRLISALAGIALIPAVYYLARAFGFDYQKSLASAALTAVAPFLVYFSQEARAYSLIFLLTTLATWAVVKRRWWLLVVTAAPAMYLHNLTVLYIAALAWLALYRYHSDWRILARALLAFGLVGILWVPWLVWGLLGQVSDVSNGFWVRVPTLGTPVYILTGLLWSNKATLLVLVTVPILTVALVYGIKATPRPVLVQLLGLLLVPLGLGLILSFLVAPVIVDRVIGSSAIALILLIAPALIPTPWPQTTWTRYALPAMFAVTLAVYYFAFYTTDRIGRYPWDYGLDTFLSEQRPNDAIFHANLATYMVYTYYLPHMPQVVWQQANDLSQSLTDQTKWAMAMRQVQFDDISCNYDRWWIAFYENPTTSDHERAEIERIVSQYGGKLENTIIANELVNARLYLVDQPCHKLTVN